ncbi:MAG: TlpA disulfide reductase family protein [Bacteroidales bacterium]
MSIRKTILLFLLLPVSIMIYGQKTYELSFQIDGLPASKIWLIFYYGDQQIRQDTAVTDASGKVVFVMDQHDQEGMYRLEKDKKQGLDFIFNKEDVNITSGPDFGLESLVVNKSEENKIFFDYYRHRLDMETRIDVLTGFLRYYPPVDSFYNEAAAYAERLSLNYKHYLDSLLDNFPGKLATRIIRLDQLPDIRPGELPPKVVAQYRSRYFSSIDLTDSLNLNTPLLPAKVVNYLSLYVTPGASREDQEKSFIQAVDSLMKFTEGGPKVREMVVNYLINGFQTYGFETVLTYLVEHYVLGQSCVSDQQEEKLKIRIEGFKKLTIGSAAPDFKTVDAAGDTIHLSDTCGKQTLLIFWSGDCPHCEAIMPELKILNGQYKDRIRFIGVSVDQDEKIWRTALEKNEISWANIAELKGWDGKIIQDYFVYATPTFLLIDTNLRIKSKPTGLAELKDALQK